jgi:hypothetical protein
MRIIQRYKRFLIKAGDHFDESNFPQLQDDMGAIKAGIAHLPEDFKNELIISFVKNQFIKTEWKERNPSLAEFVNSKSLAIEYLEELFDSCSENEVFRQELERYIRKMLN